VRWVPPAGGVHALLELEPGTGEGFTERALLDEGLLVVPGRFFEAKDAFRIGWGGPSETVALGLAALGRALDRRLA